MEYRTVSSAVNFDRDEVRLTLNLFYNENDIIELFVLKKDGTPLPGHFNNIELLLDEIEKYDNREDVKAIYTQLNQIGAEVFTREDKPLLLKNTIAGSRIEGSDVERVKGILIDVDPIKTNGDEEDSTTDSEHETGLSATKWLRSWFAEMGWTEPVMGSSGNGGQLRFLTDLPATKETSKLIKELLVKLNKKLPTQFKDKAKVDIKVYDLPRIVKVLGTVTRKGPGTEERPHRRSALISAPEKLDPVQLQDIKRIINLNNEDAGDGISGSAPSVERTKTTADLKDDTKVRPCLKDLIHNLDINHFEHSTRLALAAELLFNGYSGEVVHTLMSRMTDYDESETQYQIDNILSAITAGTRPHKCETLRDNEVVVTERCQGCTWRPGLNGNKAPSAPDDFEDRIKKAGDNILKRGNILKFLLKQVHKNHVGDDVSAKVLILSYCSGQSLTSNGIQPGITGDAQTGKSSVMDAVMHILPQERLLRTGLSDKALAYLSLSSGQVVHPDDIIWTESLKMFMKLAMSHFQAGYTYTTVAKVGGKLQALPLYIPNRLLIWLTSSEGAPDEQLESRQYPLDVDTSEKHARAVRDSIALRRGSRNLKFNEDFGAKVARYVLDKIAQDGPHKVEIPYSKWVDYRLIKDYRGQKQFFDLIDSLTILYYQQRGVIDGWIQATLKDFREALTIFKAKNESHISGLTQAELRLVLAMTARTEWMQSDLAEVLSISQSLVARRLKNIMSKSKYVIFTKGMYGEQIYSVSNVDLGIFSNVAVSWKKVPTKLSFIPLNSLEPSLNWVRTGLEPSLEPYIISNSNNNKGFKGSKEGGEYKAKSNLDLDLKCELPKSLLYSKTKKGSKDLKNDRTISKAGVLKPFKRGSKDCSTIAVDSSTLSVDGLSVADEALDEAIEGFDLTGGNDST